MGSADASSRRVPTKDASGDSSSVAPFLSTDKPSGSPARVLAAVTKKGGGLISTVFKVRSEIMTGLFTSGLEDTSAQ